jgi:hypothetical protein
MRRLSVAAFALIAIVAVGLAILSFAGAYSASSTRVAPSEPGTFHDERGGSPSILVPLY